MNAALRITTGLAALALGASFFTPASASSSLMARGTARPAFGAPAGTRDAKQLTFITLDDQMDPTFNQLLGINDSGIISGYFGIGTGAHPNKGYILVPPYAQRNYKNENFPGSVQTQVTALNNRHDTAGFWVDANGVNYDFVQWNGVFTSYRDPNTGTGTVNQLLGINDSGIAVGFYTDGTGLNHAVALNQAIGRFVELTPPGGNNAVATGINDNGDVTGFLTGGNGAVIGFLLKKGAYSEFAYPNAASTTPFGINVYDEIVGSYLDGAGKTHGFTLTNPLSRARFHSIDDPNGVGSTVVNGINSKGEVVGFYTDAAGNTNGFLAK